VGPTIIGTGPKPRSQRCLASASPSGWRRWRRLLPARGRKKKAGRSAHDGERGGNGGGVEGRGLDLPRRRSLLTRLEEPARGEVASTWEEPASCELWNRWEVGGDARAERDPPPRAGGRGPLAAGWRDGGARLGWLDDTMAAARTGSLAATYGVTGGRLQRREGERGGRRRGAGLQEGERFGPEREGGRRIGARGERIGRRG
jgi:hypothetical protein